MRYADLPRSVKDKVEQMAKVQGIPLAEVERQYDAAQLKINPGPSPWNNDILTRGTKHASSSSCYTNNIFTRGSRRNRV